MKVPSYSDEVTLSLKPLVNTANLLSASELRAAKHEGAEQEPIEQSNEGHEVTLRGSDRVCVQVANYKGISFMVL